LLIFIVLSEKKKKKKSAAVGEKSGLISAGLIPRPLGAKAG